MTRGKTRRLSGGSTYTIAQQRLAAAAAGNGIAKLNRLDLTELPPIPEGVTHLEANNNRLTSLPTLPEGLEVLKCEKNQLLELPPLPSTLEALNCAYNQLTELPELPEGLIGLVVNNNQITESPKIPKSINNINFRNNRLVKLPRIPTRWWSVDFRGNEKTLLPEFKAMLDKYVGPYMTDGKGLSLAIDDWYNKRNIESKQQNLEGVAVLNKELPYNGLSDPLTIVGSYLTGETGNLTQQRLKLKEKYSRPIDASGVGGRRKTRRRATRKSRSRRS